MWFCRNRPLPRAIRQLSFGSVGQAAHPIRSTKSAPAPKHHIRSRCSPSLMFKIAQWKLLTKSNWTSS
eukprot:3253933-Rhodomonas_salina.1